jgi:hypothetical protein
MSRSHELGIDADFSKVNIVKGANFSLKFLKLVRCGSPSFVCAFIDVACFQNPNVTLPTLPAPPTRQLHVRYQACHRTTESEAVRPWDGGCAALPPPPVSISLQSQSPPSCSSHLNSIGTTVNAGTVNCGLPVHGLLET